MENFREKLDKQVASLKTDYARLIFYSVVGFLTLIGGEAALVDLEVLSKDSLDVTWRWLIPLFVIVGSVTIFVIVKKFLAHARIRELAKEISTMNEGLDKKHKALAKQFDELSGENTELRRMHDLQNRQLGFFATITQQYLFLLDRLGLSQQAKEILNIESLMEGKSDENGEQPK